MEQKFRTNFRLASTALSSVPLGNLSAWILRDVFRDLISVKYFLKVHVVECPRSGRCMS